MAKLRSFNLSCDCSKQYVGFGAELYRNFYEIYSILKVTENRYTYQTFGVMSGDLYAQLLG